MVKEMTMVLDLRYKMSEGYPAHSVDCNLVLSLMIWYREQESGL